MKNIFTILITVQLTLPLSLNYAHSRENRQIQVYTSEFPPYNYTLEDGSVTGISTEVVQAVLKELNINALSKSMPWARAYDRTQKQENILLHSITRTEAREKLFRWVGVIAPADYALWALRNREDIVISTVEDAKRYQIGTTSNDVVEQYLKSRGCPNIQSNFGQKAYENNIKKLMNRRIDLWGTSTLPGYHFLKKMNQDKNVKKVFLIEDITGEGLYMAFGAKTSEEVVKKFRIALESVKQKGTYRKILDKYLK